MRRQWIEEVKTWIDLPRSATLAGWVRARRVLGGVTFVVLADRTGEIQLVDRQGLLESVTLESVVAVTGVVKPEARAPGGRECHIEAVRVLNRAVGVPWVPGRNAPADLEERLTYRVLSLREPAAQRIFRLEAALGDAFRSTLAAAGFLEVHTPKIVATGTEGGAELFPLTYFERPAFLAQSPQFYKELLVGSGFERVYEVGAVYRAEPHATRRHLNEYVSLDLEMGFIETLDALLDLEDTLLTAFRDAAGGLDFEPGWLRRPPVRLTLAEAADAVARHFGKALPPGHLDPEAERLLCRFVGGTEADGAAFVTAWPVDVRPFYAREWPEGSGLTASFDLIAGGLEITTGGLREHRRSRLVDELRRRGQDPEGFRFYLDPFDWGMPPHGGMAIGLERLTMMVAGLENVREASLFPRDRHRLTP
jgi:nondiscriminating aspartyl-tRNA synthetase